MSDTVVVMNQGYIQQMGTPEDIYNEPENAFVADFIGDSNIIDSIMIEDRLVEILGVKFPCVDVGFGKDELVDVVIRPEDLVIVRPEEGYLQGTVAVSYTHLDVYKRQVSPFPRSYCFRKESPQGLAPSAVWRILTGDRTRDVPWREPW